MSERTILSLTGPEAEEFLQGLVTNDVSRAQADKDGIVYAALLTPQGKYLSDFFIIGTGDGLLIDVAASHAAGLFQKLSLYKLRSAVEIAQSPLTVKIGTGPVPPGALADPRHPDLGWRLYGDEGGSDGTDWDALRVAHVIPETGVELTPETYILEAGFERLNGVDFRKGCFVGQEIVARMKHKTELKKGLAAVQIDGEAPQGTPITTDGKPTGTLYTQSGGRALALLRFDRATGPMQAASATLTPLP